MGLVFVWTMLEKQGLCSLIGFFVLVLTNWIRNLTVRFSCSYQRADPNFVMLTPNKEHLAEGIQWKSGKRPVMQSDVNSGNFDGVPRELRPFGKML